MVDGDADDAAAGADEEGWQVAVHVVEGGEGQEGFAGEYFQSAACIGRCVAQEGGAQAVGEAGCEAFGGAVAALRAVAGDEDHGAFGLGAG